jgi:hypothetical protein
LDRAVHRKDGDAHHLSGVALRTLQWIMPGKVLPPFPVVAFRCRDWRGHSQEFPTPGQVVRAVAVAEKAIVADALEGAVMLPLPVWALIS